MNLENFIGKVVTIRSMSGNEFIATLLSVDDGVINVDNPRTVIVNNGQVALVPFVLTAEASYVTLCTNQILTVLETLPETAKDYSQMIAEERQAQVAEA